MTDPKPKGKPGRKTKLTPERQTKIVNAIRAGAYMETAAAASGIDRITLHLWLKKGNKYPGTIYSAFADAVHEAMAQAEMRDVLTISKAAGDGDWRAAAWRLERKFPGRWGQTTKTELTGRDGGPVQVSGNVDFSKLSDAELRAIAGRPDPGKQGEGTGGTGTPTP